MKSINLIDGNLKFECVSGVDEFWQRVINSLKIYSTECFYNQNLGLDIKMIYDQKYSQYKLEHIKSKLKEWYRNEIENISYEIISEEERILKAKLYITHKKYSNIEREVLINE